MKRILVLILALTMVASLAACCNVPTTTEPSTEATAPTTEATQPSTQATEPSTEATEPSTEATEPSTEATEPSTEATEPSWVPEEGLEYEYLDDGTPVYACRFDDDGNMTEEIHFENGLPFWRGTSAWEDDVYLGTATFYNENGQPLRRITYKNWQETLCILYIYDENGNLLEEQPEALEDGQWVSDREYTVYDGSSVRVYTPSEGLIYSAEYDESGRLLWEEEGCPYGEYGEYTNLITYAYDEDGSYTSTFTGGTCGLYFSHYDSNGNLLEFYGDDDPGSDPDPSHCGSWQSNRYNDLGDVISTNEYAFGEQTACYLFEYEYDSQQHWTHRYIFSDGEQIAHYIRTYDDSGLLVEEYAVEEGYVTTYTYNEAGLLTEERTEYTDGTFDVMTYRYNDAGLLAEQIHSFID